MSGITPYLNIWDSTIWLFILFGKVQGPTSTGDMQREYFRYIFECSPKPQNYKLNEFYVVNADFLVLLII